jgi:hypothetical protein
MPDNRGRRFAVRLKLRPGNKSALADSSGTAGDPEKPKYPTGAVALALGHQGVVVTSELLQRVAAMPVTRKHTAWGFRRRAALANMVIPREQQCYPSSVK